jgi:hypothetical protein
MNSPGFPPPPNRPKGNALSAGLTSAPAPSHSQTVAALRHFAATNRVLEGLLKNPDLGRTSIQPAIIDGVTKLVGDRFMNATEAVQQLSAVPEKPFDQRTYLARLYQQNLMAEINVLEHHRQSFVGTGDYSTESTLHNNTEDAHMSTMSGLMTQYGK